MLLSIRALTLLLVLISDPPGAPPQTGQETDRQTVEGVTFQVPSGLRLEKVASSPLVERPIVASWDHAGRLLVLEAAGPVQRENESQGFRPHRLVRLVDDDHDGHFDRRIVAAEDLSFPVGVLAVSPAQILVSAPPEIWSLIDADGDGVCERREVWFNPGTATHCYNDLHGPYLGLDGWIYWTKGAFAAQSFTLRDGEPFTSTAAHIYRRRLEGGLIESVMTGGMDNPVEVAFTPTGERFFTSTFLQHPAGGKRDGIAHSIYGGRYGKENDALLNHWSTGDLLPIMTHLGPAAPSGLALLESPHLLRDSTLLPHPIPPLSPTLIAAQFNLQNVSLHRLVPNGSTFRTEDTTLLSTDWVQFHPTDILEDRDGSLLVLDTGGWYDLCCPSLALDQSAALGGIYRLTSNSTREVRLANPHAPQNTAEALAQFAATTSWPKRNSGDWLVAHAEAATPAIIQLLDQPQLPLRQRQELLWLLCRIGSQRARESIVRQLQAPEPELRQAAALAIAVQRWPEAAALQSAISQEIDPAAVRAMAEAIGRVGDANAIPPLMEVIARFGARADRILQHSLTYALIELNQAEAIVPYLRSEQASQVAAALRVLQERGDPRLTPEPVIRALNASASRDTALEILLDHPEWSNSIEAILPDLFERALQAEEDRVALLAIARHWGSEPAFQRFLLARLNEVNPVSSEQQTLLVSLLDRIRLEPLPAEWSEGLSRFVGRLAAANSPELFGCLAWLRNHSLRADDHEQLIGSLFKLGTSTTPAAVAAIASLPQGSRLPAVRIDALVSAVESSDSGDTVHSVWLALQRLELERPQLERLAATAPRWGLADFELALQLFANQAPFELNLALLKRLEQVPLAKTIAPDQLRELFRPRGEATMAAVEGLLGHLAAPAADTAAAINSLLASLPEGDPLRGLQVFRSSQAACSSCHQIAYVGGEIGPDLSRIGATRTPRELLEAIAFPSNRQEQSYRAEKFALIDGRIVSGLVEERNGAELVVRTGVNQRTRLRIDEIDQRLPSELSLMPAGITDALTPQQLADLLAFLQSRR